MPVSYENIVDTIASIGETGALIAAYNTLFASRALAEQAVVSRSADRLAYKVELSNPGTAGGDVSHVVEFIRAGAGSDLTTAALQTADGALWVPAGVPSILHYGAGRMGCKAGSVTENVDGWRLSDVFDTLETAREVYPDADALTMSVDIAAFNKMTAVHRGLITMGYGRQAGNDPRMSSTTNVFHIPRGVYYFNRPADLTNYSPKTGQIVLKADNAVILGDTPEKPVFDFLGTRYPVLEGQCTVLGVWGEAGCPRMGLQFGRSGPFTAGGLYLPAADLTVSGKWQASGYFTLAAVAAYATETSSFDNITALNSLNPDNTHADFDSPDDLEFEPGEPVTWPGGSGTALRVRDTPASRNIAVTVVSGALANGVTITGQTSGKVATLSACRTEPEGEGPGGVSYAVVLDGENHWGFRSDYAEDPQIGEPESFGTWKAAFEARHHGKGHCLWICGAKGANLRDTYTNTVSHGGVNIVLFFKARNEMERLDFGGVHNESDEGDLDGSTGVEYVILLDGDTPGKSVTLKDFKLSDHNLHVGKAVFSAAPNISAVSVECADISLPKMARDSGAVLFDRPEIWTVSGDIYSTIETPTPFLNISSLANFSGSLLCADVNAEHVRHSAGQYLLSDVSCAQRLIGTLGAVTGTIQPEENAGAQLGTSGRKFSNVFAMNVRTARVVDLDGNQLLEAPHPYIADAAPPATFAADPANPTTAELMAAIDAQAAVINALLAALRDHHGMISPDLPSSP